MPWNDYLTLMLTNMVAGQVLLAWYLLAGLGRPAEWQARWAPGFLAVGIVGLASGLHLALTWPLQPPAALYNALYGETTVLFAVAFLAAAVALWKHWDLLPTAVYGAIAGLAPIAIAAAMLEHGLTARPWLSAIGFVLSGLAGPLTAGAVAMRRRGALAVASALVLFIAAGIWLLTALMAYWMHIGNMARPATP